MGEQPYSVEEHGFYRQRGGLCLQHLSGQKLLELRLTGWKELIVDGFELVQERGRIKIECMIADQGRCFFSICIIHCFSCDGFNEKKNPAFLSAIAKRYSDA